MILTDQAPEKAPASEPVFAEPLLRYAPYDDERLNRQYRRANDIHGKRRRPPVYDAGATYDRMAYGEPNDDQFV